jgi:dihydroflavonol-4-reductase
MVLDLLNSRLRVIVDGGFDFCDVRDVAVAMVNGLEVGIPGQCYLLSGGWHHLKEIVSNLSEVSGRRIRVMQVPMRMALATLPAGQIWSGITGHSSSFTREALVAIEDGNRRICSDRAKQELQYEVRPFIETLRDTVHWFKEQGLIK